MRNFLHRTLVIASFVAAPALPAQLTVIDEGSFTITRNGERVGTEQFRISSSTANIMARATAVYGSRRLLPEILCDSVGRPTQYRIDLRADGQSQENIHGTIMRGRMSVRVSSPRGPAAREYVVAPGALILDDEIFHQYYFLASRKRRGTVPVVVPRRHVQILMKVTDAGADRITIGGRAIDAQHLSITDPEGAVRDVWADSSGRVLKVTIDGITALRDEPPR